MITDKKILLSVAILLVAVVCNAQTWEQRQYMDKFNVTAMAQYSKAKDYYNKNVAPVMQRLKAFPAERSTEEVQKLQQEMEKAQGELYKLQYEEYTYGLRKPLQAIRVELERNGWQKLDREVLQRFDKEWTNSSYLQFITSTDGAGFSSINEIVSKVTDLRLRGFAGSQQALEEVLEGLAPSGELAAVDIAVVRQQIEEKTKIINSIGSTLGEISSENAQFNELGEQHYQVVEKWYDLREELDNTLLDACKYCLSAPCDSRGAFSWMRKQVEPMLDSVFHKSYRERRDLYRVLLANYDHYTTEIEDLFNLIFVYVKSGQMTEGRKNDISLTLHGLDYYRHYYAVRKDAKAVSSPYLDSIISDFEKMLDNNFEDGVEKYSELAERLRGDQQYFTLLDDGVKKFAEEKMRIAEAKETAKQINSGKPKVIFTVNGVKFTMVRVNGGTFTMGATDDQGDTVGEEELPTHKVTLSSYYIGQTEVTQELWQAVMGSNPSSFNGAKRPVEQVSWKDLHVFIKKLNQLTGQNFRLPTEAEWEYAARGGSKSRGYKYSGSNNVDDVAWYRDNSGNHTHDVATKRPNELGLYDMSGNVAEFCQDWYGIYSSSSQKNPKGPASGSLRVTRGSSCDDYAWECRVAYRLRCYSYIGLRLAL